jgi:hypothetical protein
MSAFNITQTLISWLSDNISTTPSAAEANSRSLTDCGVDRIIYGFPTNDEYVEDSSNLLVPFISLDDIDEDITAYFRSTNELADETVTIAANIWSYSQRNAAAIATVFQWLLYEYRSQVQYKYYDPVATSGIYTLVATTTSRLHIAIQDRIVTRQSKVSGRDIERRLIEFPVSLIAGTSY